MAFCEFLNSELLFTVKNAVFKKNPFLNLTCTDVVIKMNSVWVQTWWGSFIIIIFFSYLNVLIALISPAQGCGLYKILCYQDSSLNISFSHLKYGTWVELLLQHFSGTFMAFLELSSINHHPLFIAFWLESWARHLIMYFKEGKSHMGVETT